MSEQKKRSKSQLKAIRRSYARKKGQTSDRKRRSHQKRKSGNLSVHKYKPRGNHPHVVVKKGKSTWISVGLTHASRSGHHKLSEVTESTGEKAYLVHYVTEDNRKNYKANPENYSVDKKTEKRATAMAENYLNKKKK